MTTTSHGLKARGALLIALGVAALFGGIELYGLSLGDDWSLLVPTVSWQLLAITLVVSPMIYGLVFASHHDEE